jgi:hypothetical protein
MNMTTMPTRAEQAAPEPMSARQADSPQLPIPPVTSQMTASNHWDHFLARWGVNRSGHRVEPGLYALGNPAPDSPVFVTANYTLSFDALRSALAGHDAYVMALDTQGINVWCAAGKGTFGTDELVQRIKATQLHQVVRRRVLILPQLGAPGVAAHEVKQRSGFKVEYGPVRAADLPEYLKNHQATAAMRRVSFSLRDRLVLIPVELVYVLIPLLIVGLVLRSAGAVAAILAGVVLFPILLPWLPTHDLSTKGLILGLLVQLPFALAVVLSRPEMVWWVRAGWALVVLLAFPPITAYLALNFTGSTSFTSKTGVRREIFAYIPVMAWMFGIGIVAMLALYVRRMLGA